MRKIYPWIILGILIVSITIFTDNKQTFENDFTFIGSKYYKQYQFHHY
jgi:hypothetical protein